MKKNNFIRNIDAFFIKKTRHLHKNFFIRFSSHYGSFSFILLFIIVTFCIHFVNLKFISLLSLISIFFDTVLVFIIKYTFKRSRIRKPQGIKYTLDPYSFPSGHISRLACITIASYSNIYLVIFLSILTISCGFSRISSKFHYFSDCFVGLLIGVLSSLLCIFLVNTSFIPIKGLLYCLGF